MIERAKSVLSAAYDLCKSVAKSEARQPLREIVTKYATTAKVGEEDPGHKGRCDFRHFADRQDAQFLGFLLVDSNRGKIIQSIPGLAELTDHELELLESAHAQMRHLIARCTDPLPENTKRAVDPYSRFAYEFKKIESRPKGFLISEDEVEVMAAAFQSQEAFRNALERPFEITRMLGTDVEKYTLQFYDLFTKGECPEDIPILACHTDQESKPYKIFKYLIGLVALRCSLRNLLQLVYQKVHMDKLVALDSDNIISLRLEQNFVWDTFRLEVYPVGLLGLRAGDIVILDIEGGGASFKNPCTLQAIKTSFSQDCGLSYDLALFKVDDQLNCFADYVVKGKKPDPSKIDHVYSTNDFISFDTEERNV